MDKRKLLKIKFVCFFIILLFSTVKVLSVTSERITPKYIFSTEKSVVGVYGDQSDYIVEQGMNAYFDSIDRCFIRLSLSQIQKYEGQVIIFAHGEEDGIQLSKNQFLSWEEFAFLLSSAKAEQIILASCYGSNVHNYQYLGPELISWKDPVDTVMIAYIAAILTLLNRGSNFELTLKHLFTRAKAIATNSVEAMPLGFDIPDPIGGGGGDDPPILSESGYEAAYKRQEFGSGATIGRYFWVNFDEATASLMIEGQTSLVTLIVEAAAINPVIAVFLITCLAANIALYMVSCINRVLHDCKVGIKVYKYLPTMSFVYHLGYDNYKSDGIIPIPWPGVLGYIIYPGIAHVPTSWVSL